MSGDIERDATARRLSRAAADVALPASARAHARDLAERLARGVRIVLLGPSGIGKSALCDALLARVPGPSEPGSRAFGGALTPEETALLGPVPEAGPVDPALFGLARVIDLMAAPDLAHFDAQVRACLEVADIVLWCTERFSPAEAALWQAAPDALKDHSFLVLTRADRLAEDGVLAARIAALQPVVSEEFHSFFPVTTPHLQHLRASGQPVPEAALAASGLRALTDALAGLVASGQRADLDGAALFLERHGLGGDDPAPEDAESVAAPAAPGMGANTGARETPPGDVAAVEACRAARDRIVSQADRLAEQVAAGGDVAGVLDLCCSISEDLVAEMRGLARTQPDLAAWSDSVEEASDKIMLMAIENDERSAIEAVSILAQLRRDLDQLAFH